MRSLGEQNSLSEPAFSLTTKTEAEQQQQTSEPSKTAQPGPVNNQPREGITDYGQPPCSLNSLSWSNMVSRKNLMPGCCLLPVFM